MGTHARPRGRGERWRGAAKIVAAWTGVIVLGASAIAAGAAVGQVTPLQAAPLIEEPTPVATADPAPEVEPAPVEDVTPPPAPSVPRDDTLPAGTSAVNIASVYPKESEDKYGVGIVIRIGFTEPVPVELRPILERSAIVTTSKTIGLAAWSWPDDYTMIYRPEEFWPKHTDVTLTASWVDDGLATFDPSRSFSIGREQILSIRHGTQVGTLYRNGRLIREVPVSLGKPTWETTSGIKTIMERYYVKRMVNPGPREPYDVQVPFALRITPSGEYLHAAPWNTYNLGVAPTSHGCTNMSMADGQWFYENALEGDPVIFFGTGVETDWDEGPGASWNIDWADWQTNSTALP